MSDVERSARERLLRAAEILSTVEGELIEIRASLPVSEREDVTYAGEEDWDFSTEVRSLIECVRAEWIGPAIRGLRDAAAYGTGNAGV